MADADAKLLSALTKARRSVSQSKGDRLSILETHLETLKDDLGLSKRAMARMLHKHGVCLGNLMPYGKTLRKMLRKHKDLVVPRKKAKQHSLVRLCLITAF